MLYLVHMTNTIMLRQVLREAWYLTWRNKSWWALGVLAFFLSGSLGYQLITQGISHLLSPIQWASRWQSVSADVSLWSVFTGQWRLLMTDPAGWFTFVAVWLLILALMLAALFVAVYALTTIVAAVKIREQQGGFVFGLAVREAWYHSRTVLGIIILAQVISNVLLALFSGPVSALMLSGQPLAMVGLVILTAGYLVMMIVLAALAVYAVVAAVMYDLTFIASIRFAWKFFLNHWWSTLKLLVSHLVLTVIVAFIIGLLVALIVIPVTIVGYILVANQQYDITRFLPNLIFLLTIASFLLFGAAFSLFQFVSWCLLFLNAEESGQGIRITVEI